MSKPKFRNQSVNNLLRYHMVPQRAGMNPIPRVAETRIFSFCLSYTRPQSRTNIDDLPTRIFLRNQPFRILVQYSIILSFFIGITLEYRWRNKNNL